MPIEKMTQVTPGVVQAFASLIPQLSAHAEPPKEAALEAMASSADTIILLARSPEGARPIIGSATLALTRTPTGRHSWIEDVVVDRDHRGQGWGKALTLACLDAARELELREVNLTSRPARVAANALYRSLGFEPRETNVYRFELGE